MNIEELRHMISRQLAEIISQADRILGGERDDETISSFASFSEELKKFLTEHSKNEMVLERVKLIPVVKVYEARSYTWVLSFFGTYLDSLNRYRAKMQALEDIRTAQGYYSSIQFLVKAG